MNPDMIRYITYAVITVIVLIILFVLYNKNKKSNIEDFEKFLNDIKDDIINTIYETIDNYMDNHDISNMKLDELEKQLLDSVYDKVLAKVKEELFQYAEASGDILYKQLINILDKAITREKVMSYIKILIDDNDSIQDKLMDLYNIAYKEEALNVIKEEKELEDLYKDTLIQDIDNAENEIIEDEGEVEELDPNEVVDPFKTPPPERINPPSDDNENKFEEDIDEIL